MSGSFALDIVDKYSHREIENRTEGLGLIDANYLLVILAPIIHREGLQQDSDGPALRIGSL